MKAIYAHIKLAKFLCENTASQTEVKYQEYMSYSLKFLEQNFHSKNFNYGVTDQFTLYRITIIVTPKTLENIGHIFSKFHSSSDWQYFHSFGMRFHSKKFKESHIARAAP